MTPCALSLSTAWTPENRSELEAWLQRLAEEPIQASGRRIALWDWDNTVIHGDVGDLLLAGLLRQNRIRSPQDGDWRNLDPYLSDAANERLRAWSGGLSPEGFLLSSENPELCHEWLSLYFRGETTDGTAGFTQPPSATFQPRFALLPRLAYGHTLSDMLGFSEGLLQEALHAPTDAWLFPPDCAQPGIAAWIRFQQPIVELLGRLHDLGVENWIVSASPLWLVEVAVRFLSVPVRRVLGLRNLVDTDGRLSNRLQSVEAWNDPGAPDTEPPILCYDEGKPEWVRAALLRDRSKDEREVRILFAAGDSETDLPLLQCATDKRVWLSSKPSERMDAARVKAPDGFLVQPRFEFP